MLAGKQVVIFHPRQCNAKQLTLEWFSLKGRKHKTKPIDSTTKPVSNWSKTKTKAKIALLLPRVN